MKQFKKLLNSSTPQLLISRTSLLETGADQDHRSLHSREYQAYWYDSKSIRSIGHLIKRCTFKADNRTSGAAMK
jgi:hypothetical protein